MRHLPGTPMTTVGTSAAFCPAHMRSLELVSAGPTPAFLTGNIGEIQALGGAALAHARFSKRYGPVYSTFGAPQPWVVTDSPAFAHDILEQHSIRPTMPSLLYGKDRQFDQANILAASGDKHRSLRGAWLPLFFTGRHAPCQYKKCMLILRVVMYARQVCVTATLASVSIIQSKHMCIHRHGLCSRSTAWRGTLC